LRYGINAPHPPLRGTFSPLRGEHRRVAHRVFRRLRLAQLLDQVEKFGGGLGLKGHHEVLIVEAERVRRVDLHARILMSDGDVIVHDPLAFGHRQQVPVARLHEWIDEKERLLAGDDA